MSGEGLLPSVPPEIVVGGPATAAACAPICSRSKEHFCEGPVSAFRGQDERQEVPYVRLGPMREKNPYDSRLVTRPFIGTDADSAMLLYGGNKRWDDLERWGNRLADVGKNPAFQDNSELWLWVANGAINAILAYDKMGYEGQGGRNRWTPRLAQAAIHLPNNSEIQEKAEYLIGDVFRHL